MPVNFAEALQERRRHALFVTSALESVGLVRPGCDENANAGLGTDHRQRIEDREHGIQERACLGVTMRVVGDDGQRLSRRLCFDGERGKTGLLEETAKVDPQASGLGNERTSHFNLEHREPAARVTHGSKLPLRQHQHTSAEGMGCRANGFTLTTCYHTLSA